MVGGVRSFRIKPHTWQSFSEGLSKTLCAPGDSTETEPDLPLSVWKSPVEIQVSSGPLQGQGLWVQQTWVWLKCSWRRSPLTPPESHQNLQRTGETDSWRAQTKHCALQDPGERSNDPTRDWPRLACECPGVSGEVWVSSGLLQGQEHWVWQGTVPLSSLPPPCFGLRSKNRKGTQPLHPQKTWLKIYWEWLHPSEQEPVFPSQFSPSGSFHKPLILIPQRTDRMKITITEN